MRTEAQGSPGGAASSAASGNEVARHDADGRCSRAREPGRPRKNGTVTLYRAADCGNSRQPRSAAFQRFCESARPRHTNGVRLCQQSWAPFSAICSICDRQQDSRPRNRPRSTRTRSPPRSPTRRLERQEGSDAGRRTELIILGEEWPVLAQIAVEDGRVDDDSGSSATDRLDRLAR